MNKRKYIKFMDEKEKYLEKVKKENEYFDVKMQNYRMSREIETYKAESQKILQAKELLNEYNDALKKKDLEIETLKKNNEDIYTSFQKIPRFIRKFFVRETEVKLLK